MKKEPLLLINITQDLKLIAEEYLYNKKNWRFSYIVPITLLSVIFGAILRNLWIALLIFSFAAYHIVRYIIEYREYLCKYKAVIDVVNRADISVSIERFDHIANETIYEPHNYRGRGYATKAVTNFYFESGTCWRIPKVDQHYKWSKNYYISSKGLENISIKGDEFYFICVQGHLDIAYIYPCKNFIFEEKSRQDN